MTIKFILGLCFIKITLAIVTIIAFGISLDYSAPVSKGIIDGISEVYNLNTTNVKYAYGKLIGISIIPISIAVLQIYFVYTKKRKLLLILFVIELVYVIARHSFPLFALLSFILLFLNESKNYFNKVEVHSNLES